MATPAVLKPLPQLHKSSRSTVLITACCGVFVSFASIVVYTFGVFLKPLAEAFHWSRTEVSLAFTISALTVAACSPFIGRLLDRLPARRVVLPCTLIYGLAFASLALLTPHLWHLYSVFVVLRIAGNGTAQLGYARVVSAWFNQQRGRALAAVMAGSGLGSVVFPPATQALIAAYGWRTAYAVLGAFILAVTMPLITLFLYEPAVPETAGAAPKTEKAGKSVRSLPFLGIALALLFFSFATNGLNAHWMAMLTDSGSTGKQAAFVLSIAGTSALAGKLAAGYTLDHFRAGRAAGFFLALSTLGFLALLAGHVWWIPFLSAILIGLGMGAESDAVPYLLTRYFGLSHFSELYGYTWCVYAVAGASGPVAMGWVYDHTGSYRPLMTICIAMVAVAAALFTALPAYRAAAARP